MSTADISNGLLWTLLIFAVILCAFCNSCEVGMLSLNRYRMRYHAKTSKRAAIIAKLLQYPDRILNAILIGSTFATAIGASVANELAGRYFGELGAMTSPIIFTLFLLLTAEGPPKTLAAIKPDKTAMFLIYPLQLFMWLLYPLVWLMSKSSNLILQLLRIKYPTKATDSLNLEELRAAVSAANGLIPSHHQSMLISILDLEKLRVEHIMIPRGEVVGIDLEAPSNVILEQLLQAQHTLLPVFKNDLDKVVGVLHTRNISKATAKGEFERNSLLKLLEEPYFIPEGTTLHTQLLNFQYNKKRMALIVDEYGDIIGLVTLEDILEEIVGEFTSTNKLPTQIIIPQADGSYLIEGSANIRDVNRLQSWQLPSEGPATLNGLITETLEAIPEIGTQLNIANYKIEVITVKENMVKLAKITPLDEKHKS